MANTTTPINQHEGNKYLRYIEPAMKRQYVVSEHSDDAILVDVYAVIVAFDVKCPARQHAIKKLLCAGIRGKGNESDDLIGALAAVNRAIELQKGKEFLQTREAVEKTIKPGDRLPGGGIALEAVETTEIKSNG